MSGFILSTAGLCIEGIQNYGFTAKIWLGATALICAFLWHYGNKNNKKMESKRNSQESLLDSIQRRREHLKNL